MVKGSAIILTNGWLNNLHAKTCHGLLRGSERFNVLAVVDAQHAGRDAGEVMDGQPRNIPVYATIDEALEKLAVIPDYAIVGVAVHGGKLPPELRKEVADCMQKGMSIVCGLHTFLSDDPEFQAIAKKYGVSLIDVRKPRPVSKLHFWTGEIYKVKTPRITVLGTDCALGKRTTAKMLTELCRENGIAAEMIYTGQTGWKVASMGLYSTQLSMISLEAKSNGLLWSAKKKVNLRSCSSKANPHYAIQGDPAAANLFYRVTPKGLFCNMPRHEKCSKATNIWVLKFPH